MLHKNRMKMDNSVDMFSFPMGKKDRLKFLSTMRMIHGEKHEYMDCSYWLVVTIRPNPKSSTWKMAIFPARPDGSYYTGCSLADDEGYMWFSEGLNDRATANSLACELQTMALRDELHPHIDEIFKKYLTMNKGADL